MVRSASRSLLAVAGGVAALGIAFTAVSSASAAPSASATAAAGRYSAEEIHHFLEGFYGNTGPRDWERENLVADDLKERAAELETHDLLLCSQNAPLDIEVGEVTTAQSAGVGWAPIWLSWGEGEEVSVFTAYVGLDASQPIKLLDVDCVPPEVGGE
ncbi:hypothetical protein [Streptomyces specialis]|uniref:hypothetical protein n=1 Tax=Streptomyces specialis TaxID=498367 RepID=UPI00073E66F1|nr:hypothetical protein [Streptomyces specialis]